MNTFGNYWTSKNNVKYELNWCDLCDVARIVCPSCQNVSCSGGGCEECLRDWDEFKKYVTYIEHYLNPEEILIYDKCRSLKKHIVEQIEAGNLIIDFKKLKLEEHFSKHEEELFSKEITE